MGGGRRRQGAGIHRQFSGIRGHAGGHAAGCLVQDTFFGRLRRNRGWHFLPSGFEFVWTAQDGWRRIFGPRDKKTDGIKMNYLKTSGNSLRDANSGLPIKAALISLFIVFTALFLHRIKAALRACLVVLAFAFPVPAFPPLRPSATACLFFIIQGREILANSTWGHLMTILFRGIVSSSERLLMVFKADAKTALAVFIGSFSVATITLDKMLRLLNLRASSSLISVKIPVFSQYRAI